MNFNLGNVILNDVYTVLTFDFMINFAKIKITLYLNIYG